MAVGRESMDATVFKARVGGWWLGVGVWVGGCVTGYQMPEDARGASEGGSHSSGCDVRSHSRDGRISHHPRCEVGSKRV
eukprot:986690-Pleurochrysis_carterae.AAC.2